MDAYNVTVEIPVTATVVSVVDNIACLEIIINEDASDDLCEKVTEILYSKDISTDHPVIHICDNSKKFYLKISNSTIESQTRIPIFKGYTIRCSTRFNLCCNISCDEDIAIDRIAPITVVSIIHVTK